jgi:hypothetical protein
LTRGHELLQVFVLILLGYASDDLIAEVVDSASHGFSLSNKIEVHVSPQKAYDSIVRDISLWWDPDHTFSGDSANLSLVDQVNGCFCEKLPPSGGVRHGTVVYAAPGKMLRLSGGLGPLQGMAVVGTMSYRIARGEEKTTVTMEYQVSGYYPDGLDTLAEPVDTVLKGQLLRLKKHIDDSSR